MRGGGWRKEEEGRRKEVCLLVFVGRIVKEGDMQIPSLHPPRRYARVGARETVD